MSGWGGSGAAYARSYASLCAGTNDAIVSSLGPAASRTLLDAGSGTGTLAGALTDTGWRVTGCEPEPTMREVSQAQYPSVDVVDGALPALPFESASFDAVTANFVLNHVPDPRAAAAEAARVAAPDGVLLATIWTATPSWFWSAVYERGALEPLAGARLPESLDFDRTASGFGQMLRDGGWRDVEVSELEWTWRPAPAMLWASVTGGIASVGSSYLMLDESGRARFRRAFDSICGAHAVDGVVALDYTAAIAVGLAG